MALLLNDESLVESRTVCRFVFGEDDITSNTKYSTQDIAAIILAIDAASAQIKRYCDFNFFQAQYSEVWDSQASDEIIPREIPIVSISSLKISANGDFSDAQEVSTELYGHNGKVINFRNGYRPPRGRGAIQVIYRAGFDPIPADIQMATLLQFQYLYKKLGTGDEMVGLKSAAKMGENQSVDDNVKESGLLSNVEGMLKPYVRFEAPQSIMFNRVS